MSISEALRVLDNREVFLDMDGVLVDLHLGLRRWFDVLDFTEEEHKQRIDEVIIRRRGFNQSIADFWSGLPMECWAWLPKTEECDEIIERAANSVGAMNVYIASTPVGSGSYSGKYEWVFRNLPSWLHKKLVDDLARNCRQFEAAGGQTIFVERPWSRIKL
jgi:FMN phosphatase YigB (HAD superfamily)